MQSWKVLCRPPVQAVCRLGDGDVSTPVTTHAVTFRPLGYSMWFVAFTCGIRSFACACYWRRSTLLVAYCTYVVCDACLCELLAHVKCHGVWLGACPAC